MQDKYVLHNHRQSVYAHQLILLRGQLANANRVWVFHVNRPSYSFLANEKERLYMRSTLYGSAEISMKNAKTALVPVLFYQQQKSAHEFLYGASYRYYLQGSLSGKTAKTNYVSMGLFNRWKDAMIAK
jgi:hypothetical protein